MTEFPVHSPRFPSLALLIGPRLRGGLSHRPSPSTETALSLTWPVPQGSSLMTLGCSARPFHGGCWENLLLMLLVAPPARTVLSLGRGQCSLPKATPYPASSDWLMGPSQTQSAHFSVGGMWLLPLPIPGLPREHFPINPRFPGNAAHGSGS